MSIATPDGIEATPPHDAAYSDILSLEALRFVAGLHRRFEPHRR